MINRLEDSTSFANTHTIIAEMNDVKSWSDEQKKKLIKIALKNSQVKYILKDKDIKQFYKALCNGLDEEEISEIMKKMKD